MNAYRARRYRGGSQMVVDGGCGMYLLTGVQLGTPAASTGQNPPATRYRYGYQVGSVIRMLLAVVFS